MIKCFWCGEEILAADASRPMKHFDKGKVLDVLYHTECYFRAAAGSAGHIKRKCSCFGGNEEDPPGLSKRAAAQAAVAAWDELQGLQSFGA